jgi:S1-C subfamily serine protease
MRLLKVAGLAVFVLGCIALVVITAPVVRGQSPEERRPFLDHYISMLQGSRLGVEIRDVDAADVTREKLDGMVGAVIAEVHAGSAAESAGMRAGDVVLTFDGEKVRGARHLARLVEETPAGRQVETTVVRNGERITLKMTPQSGTAWTTRQFGVEPHRFAFRMPERFDLNIPYFDRDALRDELRLRLQPFGLLDGRSRLGIGVQELTDQLGEYFGATSGGVLVTDVDDGTPAKTAGLRAGDVITRVNEQPVRTSAELRRRLSEATGDVRIGIVRDRKEQTLTAKLEEQVEAPRRRIVRRRV